MVNPINPSDDHHDIVDLAEIGDKSLLLKRRELALISERVFQHHGVPNGAWAAARNNFLDVVVLLKAEALSGLIEVIASPHPVHPDGLGVDTSNGGHRIDARHQHSLVIGSIVGNAVESLLADSPNVTLSVLNVASPRFLAGIVHRLARRGVQVQIVEGENSATFLAQGTIQDGRPSSHGDLVEGITVAPALWWPIYNASALALSHITEISRFHTGNTPSPTARRLAIK